MRSLASIPESCRPLLDDWARHENTSIEWVHLWEKDDTVRVTAFAYSAGKDREKPITMTVVLSRDAA